MSATPTIPRLWPGCTMVLLGDGPSLTRADVACVRGRARVLAMNYSFRLAPWADVLWSYHTRTLVGDSGVDPTTFAGRIFTLERTAPAPPWPVIAMTGATGLEAAPTGVRHGNNSGYSAINAAFHLGARRIVLLGYDCCAAEDGRFNWARPADDPGRPAYQFALWRQRFETLVAPLRAAGVEVLNASRRTALECWPRVSLAEALTPREVAA